MAHAHCSVGSYQFSYCLYSDGSSQLSRSKEIHRGWGWSSQCRACQINIPLHKVGHLGDLCGTINPFPISSQVDEINKSFLLLRIAAGNCWIAMSLWYELEHTYNSMHGNRRNELNYRYVSFLPKYDHNMLIASNGSYMSPLLLEWRGDDLSVNLHAQQHVHASLQLLDHPYGAHKVWLVLDWGLNSTPWKWKVAEQPRRRSHNPARGQQENSFLEQCSQIDSEWWRGPSKNFLNRPKWSGNFWSWFKNLC